MAFGRRRRARAERATGGREGRIFEQEIAEISKKSRGFHIEVRLRAKNIAHGVGSWHLVAGGGPGLNEQQEAGKIEFLNRRSQRSQRRVGVFTSRFGFALRTSHTEWGHGIWSPAAGP